MIIIITVYGWIYVYASSCKVNIGIKMKLSISIMICVFGTSIVHILSLKKYAPIGTRMAATEWVEWMVNFSHNHKNLCFVENKNHAVYISISIPHLNTNKQHNVRVMNVIVYDVNRFPHFCLFLLFIYCIHIEVVFGCSFQSYYFLSVLRFQLVRCIENTQKRRRRKNPKIKIKRTIPCDELGATRRKESLHCAPHTIVNILLGGQGRRIVQNKTLNTHTPLLHLHTKHTITIHYFYEINKNEWKQ